ncbi:hypothetical protein C2G38_2154071 [Gigaspora rosea]|uniref:Uncharacterized protein n=1 Tax=Gigaspora rosea TaxID=44941 RepID=A0A397W6S6_9GLOM|nr:hypothetical protein C2G38_2154071 [Gigaspora rosea]
MKAMGVRNEIGVQKDGHKAFVCYQKSAELGDSSQIGTEYQKMNDEPITGMVRRPESADLCSSRDGCTDVYIHVYM